MFFDHEKFAKRAEEIGARRWANTTSLEWFYTKEGGLDKDEVYIHCPDAFGEETIRLGAEFVGRDRYVWLHREVTIPEAKPGMAVAGMFDFGKTGVNNKSGFESLLYINGQPYQGVDGNHKEVILTPFAGQTVTMTFLLWSGLEGGGPKRDQYHRLQTARIGYLDETVDDLWYLFKNTADTAKWLPAEDTRKYDLVEALEQVCQMLDFDSIHDTAAEALAFLERALDAMPKDDAVTVYATGHTHIDVTWLWRLKHTREKIQRSFSTVLRLMEEFPEYRFLQTQPQLYQFIKNDRPDIYERIKARIAEGRWEADGGMWLEADCNIPSGESLARQFLYGIRFMEREFGKKCSYLWLPDVFGYSWALPQIMKLCGLDTFMTTKISWNQYNEMPNDLFYWRGMDGTDMLTYFVNAPNNNERSVLYGKVSNYSAELAPLVAAGAWKRFKNKELTRDVLIAYGYGDGGGGPNREMLKNMQAMKKIPGLPKIKPSAPGAFFQKLHENVEKTNRYVPVWDGELYLELHRATYTAQGHNKWHNRKLEYALTQLEWLYAVTGVPAPQERLQKCWEQVLCAQFHDTIPGSSIREVYEDTDKIYEAVWQEIKAMEEEVGKTLTQAPSKWSVLRFADTSAPEAVFVPQEGAGKFLCDGKVLPSQKVPGGYLVENTWKPLGCNEISFQEGIAEEEKTPFSYEEGDRTLHTPYYQVQFDENGAMISLFDKTHNREVLKGKSNILRVYEDRPKMYDAWDVDIYYTRKYEDAVLQSVKLTENGPVRLCLEFTYAYRKSSFCQKVYFYAGNPRIDFETTALWQEDHRLLRTLFDVDVRATEATYDIQFGHVRRPTHWNTSWDWARFEVCGHKWADLSQADYGVSLLSDSKYGYSVKDSVMGLSLLTSSKEPDTHADMGEHHFTYALLPHEGSLDLQTVEQGMALNQPALCLPGQLARPMVLGKDCAAVKIDAIKPAEDGNGLVVHLHECMGGSADVTLTLREDVRAFAACNLLEEYDTLTEGSEIRTRFRPFEIKCFRIFFR